MKNEIHNNNRITDKGQTTAEILGGSLSLVCVPGYYLKWACIKKNIVLLEICTSVLKMQLA